MAAKMTVVLLKATGNVLGAMTRRGDPTGKLDPAVYLSQGISLRDPVDRNARIAFPTEDLDVQVVDLVEDTLVNPHSYYFANNAVQLTTQSLLTPHLPKVNPAQSWSVRLTTNAAQTIWIQMDSVADRSTLFGTVEAPASGNADVDVPFAIPPGTYNTVVFATGKLPLFNRNLAVA